MQNTLRNTIRISLAAAAAALLLPVGASAQNAQNGKLNDFAKKAAVGGMAEVELGKVASEKASNPRVKEFGQKLVADHSKANAALKSAASKDGITLPASIDAHEQHEMNEIKNLSGADFDKKYIAEMVEDHKKDVREFEEAAKKDPNSEVGKFAQQTLPTLREHLQMAQDVEKELKGKM
jgi:putative membrane protein